jgi:hypothetical protein
MCIPVSRQNVGMGVRQDEEGVKVQRGLSRRDERQGSPSNAIESRKLLVRLQGRQVAEGKPSLRTRVREEEKHSEVPREGGNEGVPR